MGKKMKCWSWGPAPFVRGVKPVEDVDADDAEKGNHIL